MFFRRVFEKKPPHELPKNMFGESPDCQSPPSPPMKVQKRRASIEEKQSRSLSVLQLTPLWEHIIRTNSMPHSIILADVFEEFYERLHDPEWQVRQHALRVLVDVLIVMGQQADYHINELVHPLVDNLGHIAPAVRKGALDALRVYVAQTAVPETVMVDIMNYGMNRPVNDPFGGRMTVAVMLALPALILPVLITQKRAYVVKAVMDALANKMVKITYQEIALKILLKIKDMIGLNEFNEHMPSNVKKDFDLLCKVYGLPKSPGFHDELHVPAQDLNKPSKFVPRKDIQGNNPSSHAPIEGSKYFGNNYDLTYPFERTRLSNNLGTPKRVKSPRVGSGGILRSMSDNNLSVDFNGNSSGSESGGSSMSFRTLNNTTANSKTISHDSSRCDSAKVIMETEIKINPETAVTMRILEQNPSTQTDESEDEPVTRRIITDFSAPYPVTPMRPKNSDDFNNNHRFSSDLSLPKNGRRVRFGGEIVKMRTPDSDTVDLSDENEPPTTLRPPPKIQKQTSFFSDNSSVSSDNSTANEYIKPMSFGFVDEPLSLNQYRSNIDQLKERKFEDSRRKPPRAEDVTARPISARPHSTSAGIRPLLSDKAPVVHSPPPSVEKSSSSSTDYSQELTIGIPEVENLLPAHFTPPSIMIKKTTPQSNFSQSRPFTSPMLSPRIVTTQPSSSSHSSKNNSPIKSAPTTPNFYSPSKRMRSPDRMPMRRSVSSLSPRMIHHGVTMLHNLQRSPMNSPGRSRRASVCSADEEQSPEQRIEVVTNVQPLTSAGTSHRPSVFNDDSTPLSSKDSPQYKSWEELGIVDYFTLKDLKSGDFRLRSRGICAVEDALKSSENLALVQPYLDTLLRVFLTSERHPDVLEDQRRVLSNLVSRLPLENLEDRITQIVTGLCRQGGPGSNLVAKTLMQRLPTAAIVLKLLSDDFLQVRSSKFRENAMQMVIFALLTFPSTYFDVANCVERTARAALDRKKRVRQAALDVLAVLGQISSPKVVIDVVSQVAEFRKDGLQLLAAVKARLARKQLPLVGNDGSVQYALKIPNATNVGSIVMFGSDVEYICSGSGSVSPTSLKNRSFSNGVQGQEPGRALEERRIADGLNRYAAGSTLTPTKSSPWSRIPVKSSSGSDDDHGYVVGTAIQSLQRPLESTGRFFKKVQSRSFPELSDATKERSPVRQFSDGQPSKNRHTKLPVASTKFPAVETTVRSNTYPLSKNPYTFAPSFSSKAHRMDENPSDSTGSLPVQTIHVEPTSKMHSSNDGTGTKQRQAADERKNSGRRNGNELTIQQLTSVIGLVESEDGRSEREVVSAKPASGVSKLSEGINNSDLLENYVDDQARRTSGKTNSHILSDVDNNPNSLGSTPLHLSMNPTSSEMADVRSEIAVMQSALADVKKEMVNMQKQQGTPSRPPSDTSNKTFVFEDEARSKTPVEVIKTDKFDENQTPIRTAPTTPKSILKPASPFHRMATPQPDEVIDDEESSNSPIEIQFEVLEHDGVVVEPQGSDEVDESPRADPGDTMADSTSYKFTEMDDDDETIDYQEDFSEEPPIAHQRTPINSVKRQPPLKRNHKVTPVKNSMPNINQPSSVSQHQSQPHKVNNTLFPTSLRRFERPKEAIQSCLAQLDSSSWENVMDGLKIFVRLIRHHPEYVDNQIHVMTLAVAKHVRNLRSQVSRAACSASSEFFITNARALDADAEELAAALLNRTADTNKFLRGDALRALESMCDALPPSKVILILTYRGANHQNAAVRCTTAKLLNQLVFRIGCDRIFNMHKDIRDRLILTGANLLMEGSLETRNYTKELFKQLSIHSLYHKILLDVIPSNVYRNIEKSLKSIR